MNLNLSKCLIFVVMFTVIFLSVAMPGCNTIGTVDEQDQIRDSGELMDKEIPELQSSDTAIQDQSIMSDTSQPIPDQNVNVSDHSQVDDHPQVDDHSHGSEKDQTTKCVTLGGYCVKAGENCKPGTIGGSEMGCHGEGDEEGNCCLPETVNRCEARAGTCRNPSTGCATGEVLDSSLCLDPTEICCVDQKNSNCVIKGGYCATKDEVCKDGYSAGTKMGCPGDHDDGTKCCRSK
jgi:hypothetical protein